MIYIWPELGICCLFLCLEVSSLSLLTRCFMLLKLVWGATNTEETSACSLLITVKKKKKTNKNKNRRTTRQARWTDLVCGGSGNGVRLRHDLMLWPSGASLLATVGCFIHTLPFSSAAKEGVENTVYPPFCPGLINAWITFTSFHLMELCFLSASLAHSAW